MKIIPSRIKIIIRSNRREIRFIFLFILFFSVCQTLHYLTSSYTTSFFVNKLHVLSCSKIINIITPEENTFVQNNIIGSGIFKLEIVRGCEGIEGILLIIAAICAFYMGVKQKIFGILIGSLIIYFSNLARIIVLYYTVKYKPALFEFMHIYIGQTFIILIGILFFITWISKYARINEKT